MPGIDEESVHRQRFIRTAARHKEEWVRNAEMNAAHVKHDLNDLWRDGGQGLEAVSVAAGPSLDGDLGMLREDVKGREVVAVDASLKFLTENRVRPDFVMCLDVSEAAAHMLLTSGVTDLPLLLNVTAHPSVASLWRGPIYWYVVANNFLDADRKEMIQHTHQRLTKVGVSLFQGGNVSSAALAFLMSVRSADLVFLHGHDFCWKERMYAGGGMRDLEDARMATEGKAGTLYDVENSRGEPVRTNLSLKKFAEWHDEAITASAGRVVNRTTSTILK
jgi:hypothetical protein